MNTSGEERAPTAGSPLVSPADTTTASSSASSSGASSGTVAPSWTPGAFDGPHGSLQLDPDVPGLLWMSGQVDLDVVGATAAQRRAREELMRGVDVVDASQVTFIDSTGVHLLIVAAIAARERGSRLRLRRPVDLVLALVQVMGLDDLFTLEAATG